MNRGSTQQDAWFSSLVVGRKVSAQTITSGGSLTVGGNIQLSSDTAHLQHDGEIIMSINPNDSVDFHTPVSFGSLTANNSDLGNLNVVANLTTSNLTAQNIHAINITANSYVGNTVNFSDGGFIDGVSIGSSNPAIGVFSVLQAEVPFVLTSGGTPLWRFNTLPSGNLVIQYWDGDTWVTKSTIAI